MEAIAGGVLLMDSMQLKMVLVGNFIAVVALGSKAIFDLYFNPRWFLREMAKIRDDDVQESLRKASEKRDRSNRATTVALLAVALSHAIFMSEAVMNEVERHEGYSTAEFQEALGEVGARVDSKYAGVNALLAGLEVRVKRLEDTIDPPGGTGILAILDELAKAISSLEEDHRRDLSAVIEKLAKIERRLDEIREQKPLAVR